MAVREPTANEMIGDAMLMAGIGDIYNNADPNAFAAGLRWLNDLMDQMQGKPVFVYGVAQQTFLLTAGTNTLSIPNVVGWRPNEIKAVSIKDNAVDTAGNYYPVRVIGPDEWAALTSKDVASGLPELVYFDWQVPSLTVYLYPTPSASNNVLYLWCGVQLQSFTDLTDTLVAPQGWSLALKALLARIFCAAFRMEPTEELKRQSRRAELVLQLGHHQPTLLPLAWPLRNREGWGYNIYTDE